MATGQFAVASATELPTCVGSKEGYVAYVRDEGHSVTCKDGAWTASDGSTSGPVTALDPTEPEPTEPEPAEAEPEPTDDPAPAEDPSSAEPGADWGTDCLPFVPCFPVEPPPEPACPPFDPVCQTNAALR